MPRVRVMQLLTSFEVGGAECVALDLARSLDPGRFEVQVGSLSGEGPMAERLRSAGLGVFSLDRSRLSLGLDVGLVARLAAILRRERADVLHCHNTFAKTYGVLAGRLAGVPALVVTHHASGSRRLFGAKKVWCKLLNPAVTRFVTVSEYVRREAGVTGRVDTERTSVIYNGIDLARFHAAEATDRSDGPVTIGCVARLSPEKRHVDLLAAMARLTDNGVEVRLQVIGGGALADDLRAEARRLGVEDEVRFLGTRDDVPDLLRGMDVFVLASNSEGLPLSIIEAMATRLAVVATSVGGVPELVEDGVTGRLVPAEDPEALAGALRELVEDAELRRRMGRAGRRAAEDKFSLQAAARKHEELYERLLAEKGIRV